MNTYIFENSTKNNLFKTFALGLVLLLVGVFFSNRNDSKTHTSKSHETHHISTTHEQVETHATPTVHSEVAEHNSESEGHHVVHPTVGKKVLINFYALALFAFFIGVAAIFFLAASTIAWGGWQIQIQKIPLAIAHVVPFFLGALLLCALFFGHDIFEWMHEYLYDINDKRYDKILAEKHDFLNPTTFWVMMAIMSTTILTLAYKWRKNLLAQDTNPSLKLFSDSRTLAAISIVLIAFVVDTLAAWYLSMSIQPHWYSTLFPWYMFASAAVSMFSIVMLTIQFLKSKGYLQGVNDNHLHDVGKLMFAISVFWTYLFFSQYMLIWYANIPEETIFFMARRYWDNHGILFHFTFFLNFVMPFFVLLRRSSKRNTNVTMFMAFVIIIGHWFDYFLMVAPVHIPTGGVGLIGLGMFLCFGALIAFIILTALSKVKDLSSSTHPYIKESYIHQI